MSHVVSCCLMMSHGVSWYVSWSLIVSYNVSWSLNTSDVSHGVLCLMETQYVNTSHGVSRCVLMLSHGVL